ncbi:Uncharacterised protein [Paucimonas lemoignei]|jgi:hypothetical protein|nr:Uncharacterised protein [Paucimonas lemoignei]
MEYVENGDFSTGKLEPWRPVLGSTIEIAEEDGRYHAVLGGGDKLNQSVRIADVQPRRFLLTIELKVVNGTEEDTGQIHLIWASNAIFRTYLPAVSDDWATTTFDLFITNVATTNNIEVLVEPRFDKEVLVGSVSLRDERKRKHWR